MDKDESFNCSINLWSTQKEVEDELKTYCSYFKLIKVGCYSLPVVGDNWNSRNSLSFRFFC